MSTISLIIDGQTVQARPGETILAVARRIGLDIPTLCHLEKCRPATSCLVCLVKTIANGNGRLVPSCATPVQPGMIVESETAEVHEARRTALELLLSDHVGDCLSPCHRICPLQLNIPVMIRQIEAGHLNQAIATVRTALPLPTVLGRLCHHPCENGCRRGTWDQPAAIRDLERHVADADMGTPHPYFPPRQDPTRKSIAIIGSGPAGLAAADTLLRQGHACTMVDRHDRSGGSLRSQVPAETLPPEVLDRELALLQRSGLTFKLGVELGTVITLDGLLRGFDAVILALGELTQDEAALLGVAHSGAHLQVDPATYQTSVPNVFAAGSVVKPVKHLVRALSEGKAAAVCVARFLAGKTISRNHKVFSSIMGRLEKEEVALFLQQASPGPRIVPTCVGCGGFTEKEGATEAARCLHCDCRAAGHCALQEYAARHGAEPSRFRDQRRAFEQQVQPGNVLYEPGKCILCGICVQLTEQAREPLGLTFIGRGFDVRVAAPFQRAIAEGLQKVGAECVEKCPTGALSFRDPPNAGG